MRLKIWSQADAAGEEVANVATMTIAGLQDNLNSTPVNNGEIKIFAGRSSRFVALQVLHQLFRATGRFLDSIACQPNLWAGVHVSGGTIVLQAAKQLPFMV
jgi:hypothetical protein